MFQTLMKKHLNVKIFQVNDPNISLCRINVLSYTVHDKLFLSIRLGILPEAFSFYLPVFYFRAIGENSEKRLCQNTKHNMQALVAHLPSSCFLVLTKGTCMSKAMQTF